MTSKTRKDNRKKQNDREKKLMREKRSRRDRQEVENFAETVQNHTIDLLKIALKETLGIGDQRFQRVLERYEELRAQDSIEYLLRTDSQQLSIETCDTKDSNCNNHPVTRLSSLSLPPLAVMIPGSPGIGNK